MKLERSPSAQEAQRRMTLEGGGDYVGRGANPRSQMVKSLEMTARRARHFERLCALYTEMVGSDTARTKPPTRSEVLYTGAGKAAREAFGEKWWRHPTIRCGWEQAYDYWATGALTRSVEDLVVQIPEENRKRVEKETT